MAKLKSGQEIQLMRAAGKLAAEILSHAATYVRPGISTEEINTVVHEYTVAHGAYPTPLKYRGFPKSVCTSINDVICHGIPSPTQILREGDIINLDITCTLDGWLGDTSKTYCVGKTCSQDKQLVMDVAAESLARALAVVKHGVRMGDVGYAIQSYAEGMGCGVVRDFVGHGIGKVFHEPDLTVPHYGERGTGVKLVRGMTFTIEPMINGGSWRHRMLADGWTALTTDGKPSAQFEHTLALVGDGIEVLTAFPDDPILLRAIELGAIVMYPKN